MTVVITVGGANFGLTDGVGRALGGYVRRQHRRHKIGPAQPSIPFSLARRVAEQQYANLREAALSMREPFELWGASSGAERIAELLHETAPEHLARVVLLGCPASQHGGVGGVGFRGPRTPVPSTRFETLVIARLGDPFANADQWGISQPRTEAAMTLSRLLGGGLAHADYSGVDLDECRTRAAEGNTRFLVAP
ncbi:hypothetical protein [Mycobacterium sp. SMC-4]|uniref:hypothetical protein n=1 Tax=Mycobacterium sp. SMC-4 TaxID=2857059 RepID=UPI0021B42D48|nr:hypothetical protein [Mycobacterium sp. SMC-4]UXA19565.1 hypothetical protein KXD98_08185 [Mycobacterium sp. SMC-4]